MLVAYICKVNQFDNLRIQLELLEWPNIYLYKFIVPNENEKIALVTSLFDENTEIGFLPSGKGNYLSISAKEVALSAQSIIEKYEKVSKIKGIITL